MRSGLPLTVIVLAGDRVSDDPVARTAGVPYKALAPIGGASPWSSAYWAPRLRRRRSAIGFYAGPHGHFLRL